MAAATPLSRGRGPAAIRAALVGLLAALALAGSAILSGTPASAQQDARYFADTGFRIDDDKVWDYFQKRGGIGTFGLPTSRTFPFLGSPTQFFQRQVVQVTRDGVHTLNLLDDGLLPYTTINGSTFPAVDPAVTGAAPKPGSGDYGAAAVAFLKQYAPNTFDGQAVGFYETFARTVTLADAFPDGGGNADLLPLLNLEIWGLPTSKPARDPKNNSFIYLRFQRGIMHYDAGCSCTQGLLLGDALKALITGKNLPDDLAAQAADSPLLRQYDPNVHNGPLRSGLPKGTELANAFRPSLDAAPAGPAPAVADAPATARPSSGSAAPPPASGQAPPTDNKPPAAAPSGPPDGDPTVFMLKVQDAGKNAKEAETKKGSDNRMTWSYARYERERTFAGLRSGPVTVFSRSIITRDTETARQIYDEETKQNEKFPEAKDKVGSKFPFNMEGDEYVGDQAAGASACVDSGCTGGDNGNLIHRRMVFRVGPFVGVIYTFGSDDPEGNTQAYTRRLAEVVAKRMRDSIPE